MDWLFLSLQVKMDKHNLQRLSSIISPNYNHYANKSGETRQAEKADRGLKWCQHRGYDTSPIWEVLYLLLHRRRKWTCTVYLYICQWGDPGRGDASASVWGTLECKLAPASTHPLWFDTTRAKTENWEENEGRPGVEVVFVVLVVFVVVPFVLTSMWSSFPRLPEQFSEFWENKSRIGGKRSRCELLSIRVHEQPVDKPNRKNAGAPSS